MVLTLKRSNDVGRMGRHGVLKGENHPMFGTKRTDETKEKIKKSPLGRKHTEKAKLKMSKAKKK